MTSRPILAAALLATLASAGALVAIDGMSTPTAASTATAQSVPTLPADRPTVPVARGVIDVETGVVQIAGSRDGIVRDVLVIEGDRVTRGQTLAILDDRAADISLDVARRQLDERRAAIAVQEARLAQARRERDRLAPLALSGTASAKAMDAASFELRVQVAELDARRAEAATAEAQVTSARYERELRTIRAPADGTIIRRLVRPGDGISTLNVTTMFLFAPGSERIARIEIEDLFVGRLTEGLRADIALDSDPRTIVAQGRLARIGQAFGPRRATVYEPRDRADVRVLEAIVTFDDGAPQVPLGQRIIVRFPEAGVAQARVAP